MNIKQAVILAGGLGTRLKPYTETTPKPLIEIYGKPFLVWQLEYLQQQGITRVLILVSYLGDQIVNYFRKNPLPGLQIEFNTESTPMGTGGALKLAENKLENQFWLLNGDTLLKLNLGQIESLATPNLMVCFNRPKDVGVQGNVIVEDNKAVSFSENSNFVDAGVYLFDKSMIKSHSGGVFSLSQLLQQPMKLGQVYAHVTDVPFYDMGTIDRLKNAPKKLFE